MNEWLKIMLEEIDRKAQQAEADREEAKARRKKKPPAKKSKKTTRNKK
jgi:hypothetical protein